MATINLPFAASATRRAPTTDELANGYGCGDADKELFDWLAWFQTGQIARAISKSGLTVDDTDIERLARSMRKQGLNYITTIGGTAQALTVALDPIPTAYTEITGTPLRLLVTTPNTATAPTLNINGLGVKTIKRLDGTAIAAGDLQGLIELIYDGTDFRLTTLPAGQGGFAQLVQFAASGTFTPPAGVYRVFVRAWSGGGGGGGANTGGSGGGGGSGGYSSGWVAVTPGVGVTVTIGAGGTGGASGAGSGGTGGTTSFGSAISITGGGLGAGANGGVQGLGGAGGTATGGQINRPGNAGSQGYLGSPNLGGIGAGAPFGSYATNIAVGSGPAGIVIGGGGSGATGLNAGGAGAAGYMEVSY